MTVDFASFSATKTPLIFLISYSYSRTYRTSSSSYHSRDPLESHITTLVFSSAQQWHAQEGKCVHA